MHICIRTRFLYVLFQFISDVLSHTYLWFCFVVYTLFAPGLLVVWFLYKQILMRLTGLKLFYADEADVTDEDLGPVSELKKKMETL